MNTTPSEPHTSRPVFEQVDLRQPEAPSWVRHWLGDKASTQRFTHDDGQYTLRQNEGVMLISATLAQAGRLPVDDFQACVRNVYLQMYQLINQSDSPHPWRFWNFVPDILKQEADGLLRYMVFNAGRHQAMLTRHGVREFTSAMVAASAVGSPGSDLVVHLLAGSTPGAAIENPRQVSAFHYSPRYGPLPPCFARATKVMHHQQPHLLISGTASIVGEDSTHGQHFESQCQEVIANFTSLIAHAQGLDSMDNPPSPGRQRDAILSALRDVRVYLPDVGRRDQARDILAAHCLKLEHLEFMAATICRPELQVEIEARASLQT